MNGTDVTHSAPMGDNFFMRWKRRLLLAGLVLLVLPWGSSQAGPFVGVYVGGPYYRPYRYYYGGPYYYYYPPTVPLYVAPPPPVVVQPAAPQAEVIPGPIISTTPSAVPSAAAQSDLPPPRTIETRVDEIDRLIQHLSNPDDKVRADVAIRLGRMKARRAEDSLERVLASDRSADVRDAAARALGLIGMPASLPALQRAAQADEDRGVRNSAQFAVDVIRGR
jgi:hypothetical protein